jgi:hypothetical protein
MTEEPQVVADFRRQLRALPERAPRRRRAPAVAIALVAALIGGAIAIGTRDAPDSWAVEHRGRFVTVRLLDATEDPAKLTRELREKGVYARIRTTPVAPRNVGHFMSVTIGPPGGWTTREPPAWMREVRFTGREITFPAGVPVELDMMIGVPRVE